MKNFDFDIKKISSKDIDTYVPSFRDTTLGLLGEFLSSELHNFKKNILDIVKKAKESAEKIEFHGNTCILIIEQENVHIEPAIDELRQDENCSPIDMTLDEFSTIINKWLDGVAQLEKEHEYTVKNFCWNMPHDFSEMPEQAFKAIARCSREITLDINEDGKLKIRAPKSLCSMFNFVRRSAQMEDFTYPKANDTHGILTKGSLDFFSKCSFTENINEKKVSWSDLYDCKGCSEGCPCRLYAAAYYKWLMEYDRQELIRQREEYKKNKDQIDGSILTISSIRSCILKDGEEYPHMSTAFLNKIRQDIDNWKYCLYTTEGYPNIIKHYTGTEYVESNNLYKNNDILVDWIKNPDSNYRKTQDEYMEINENLMPYLFVIDLLKRGKYAEYYSKQIDYEKTIEKSFTGNSYSGCVVGSDREEVFKTASELCEKIRCSYDINAPRYIHITALELAQRLAVPEVGDSLSKPITYKRLVDGAIYLITGLNEFVSTYKNSREPRWIVTRQCKHLLKEMTPFTQNRFIILAGEKIEVDEFLKLIPSFELIFKRNSIIIDDMSVCQICDIYTTELKNNNLEFTEANKADFTEYLTNNIGSFPLRNSSLARFLAEYSIKQGHFSMPEDISGLKKADFMEDLDSLIGMTEIKKSVKAFYDYARYTKTAGEQGAVIKAGNMHMLFTGNPGTGKTTVARILARALYDIGIVKENKLIEVSRDDLVGQYLGQTAPKTKEVINKAMNGVLFIDEAYSLYETGASNGDMYGSEAISTLIKAMEDHKDSLIVIFAGYKKEMWEFLEANSGIKSRIGYTFHFEDYSEDELLEMYHSLIKRTGLSFDDNCISLVNKKLYDVIKYFHGLENLGNGRFVDKLYQYTLQQRSSRDDPDTLRLTEQDIPNIEQIIEYMPDNESMVVPESVKENDRKRVAYHELGHAIVGMVLDSEKEINRITIESSANGALGYVRYDSQEKGLATKTMYLNRICRLMAGLASEEIFMGEYSNGGGSDLPCATDIAKHMILKCGMGNKGFATCSAKNEDLYIEEVNEILSIQYERAKKVLEEKKEEISKLSVILLAEKTIDKDTIQDFLRIPKKKNKF